MCQAISVFAVGLLEWWAAWREAIFWGMLWAAELALLTHLFDEQLRGFMEHVDGIMILDGPKGMERGLSGDANALVFLGQVALLILLPIFPEWALPFALGMALVDFQVTHGVFRSPGAASALIALVLLLLASVAGVDLIFWMALPGAASVGLFWGWVTGP